MSRILPVIRVFMAIAAFSALPVFAAEVPASKCVTASTNATRISYAARLEKDILPYASQANAAPVIQLYRDGLDIAWEAMEQPYCGAGIYGLSPFIKSYAKSADRERANFLAAVKKLPKDGSAPVVPAPVPAPIAVVPAPIPKVPAPAPAPVKVPVVAAKTVLFAPGIVKGQRASRVTDLQKLLTKHFGIKQDDSNVTGYFGPKTEALVIKFQLEKKLVSSATAAGAGLVGPKTCAALNHL